MDHRHAQILLQDIDHRQHAPTRTEQIDRLRALAVLEEGALHVGVDLVRGQVSDLVERRRYPLHAEHLESGLHEIFGEQVVDRPGEIGRAHEALDLERLEGAHVIAAGGEHRHLVLALPFFQELGLALVAEQHERRRALGMDQVAADLGELRQQRLVRRDRPLELVGGAFLDAEKQRDHADALGQHADQLLEPARPQGRLDAAQHASPAGEGHGIPSLFLVMDRIRSRRPNPRFARLS